MNENNKKMISTIKEDTSEFPAFDMGEDGSMQLPLETIGRGVMGLLSTWKSGGREFFHPENAGKPEHIEHFLEVMELNDMTVKELLPFYNNLFGSLRSTPYVRLTEKDFI